MSKYLFLSGIVFNLLGTAYLQGQTGAGQPAGTVPPNFPAPSQQGAGPPPGATHDIGPIPPGPPRVTRVRDGDGSLPNSAGQVWKEYDIRPYVDRMQGIANPEQTIIDWVLRETGTKAWFGRPVGIMNADATTLRVYHTPQQQAIVGNVVERFVRADHQHVGISVHLVTIGSPNWRTQALKLMQPITTQTPGLDAWLLTRENAAVLASQIRSRVDYREHNSDDMTILSGQSHTLMRRIPKSFSKSIVATPTAAPGYQIVRGEVKEGFDMTISPLVSLDGQQMEAVIDCRVDQMEKLSSINVEVPPPARGLAQVDIPQITSWRLHERFHWPMDQVLLVSRGVVAMPGLQRPDITNLPAVITSNGKAPRAEALLFIVCRQLSGTNVSAAQNGQQGARAAQTNYHGRY